MLDIQLDHVAIGAQSIADAEPFLEGTLAGTKSGGFASGPPFGFMQWVYAGGGRIEVIYPIGADGFLHRFLARGGPRVHHVTFKVESLDETIARASAMNYGIASEDRSDPYWQEAFLHPKQAQGIVVQLVEHHPRPDSYDDPANGTPLPHAVRVIGLRLVAPSAAAARRQWGELLGGSERRAGEALVFSWPGSPLVITVDVDASADPGPRCIELAAPRPLALPADAVPKLGTRFVQVFIGV
jgi:methylmalonyl-CoA/ethylmalonyl-CoA epimerase